MPQTRKGREATPKPTTDSLRRRISQAEMQLREMEEEAKRFAEQHKREVEVLQNENHLYKEKLEDVRMEECLTPAEFEEVRKHNGHSKLLGANSYKYRVAKEQIESKRAECIEQEANLVFLRQQLNDARRAQQAQKRMVIDAKINANSRLYSALQMNDGTKGQLKGLEYHIDRELLRFSEMVSDAKGLREAIDALLITQTRYERNYRKHENELMEKKKEMSFLIEVCNLLFQEREQHYREQSSMKSIEEQEFSQYEEAFSELTAVLEQDVALKSEYETRMAELKKSIRNTRTQRLELEKENESKQFSQRMRQRLSRIDDSGSGDEDLENEPDNVQEETLRAELNHYETIMTTLGEIVGSDQMEDVVHFADRVAHKRFECFSEINRLNEESNELAKKRKELLQLKTGEMSKEKQSAMKRMAEMRKELRDLQYKTLEEESLCSKDDRIWQRVLMELEKMFEGLNCSPESLRLKTGMESVLRATAPTVLQLISQRLEEYLIAYNRKVQSGTSSKPQSSNVASINAAKAILRRPDIHAKGSSSTAERIIQNTPLPYSADDTGDEVDARPLSKEEMDEIVRRKGVSVS